MDSYDLCIIGAGMFGSAAARYASANPSFKVCLIGPIEPTDKERKTREIHSSYYDEGRVVQVTHGKKAFQVLSKHTIDRFQELEKLSGIQFYHPVGLLMAGERGSNQFLSELQAFESTKVPYVDLSKENILKERYPFLELSKSFHSIMDDYGAGHISPRGIVEAQKKVAFMQGCHIIDDVVGKLKKSENGFHEILTEKGKLLRAKRILVCTGAFTKFKDLYLAKNLKIIVHKETAALCKITDENEIKRLGSMPAITILKHEIEDMPATTRGTYILPPIKYPDGNYYLKIGPVGHQRNSIVKCLEEAKEWYSDSGDIEVKEKLTKFLFKLIPNLKVDEIKAKLCITCDSPSGHPYIDRLSPTVTVAVVGNGLGATTCDEIGRIAAHLSLTGRWDSELSKRLFEAIVEE